MTPDAQQPQMEYEFACNCCENKCRVIAYNALPPDCGCIINSDCGAIWSTRPHTPAPATCAWTEDEDGNWDTECGNKWTFFDGTPSDNGLVFCPFCGRTLRSTAQEQQR